MFKCGLVDWRLFEQVDWCFIPHVYVMLYAANDYEDSIYYFAPSK